jgi:SAM-dependent methyltransferase
MNTTRTSDEQKALWNGPSGSAWVDGQEMLDRLLRPFEELLLDAMSGRADRRILDVGCGTGSTTLAAARQLGARGRSVGVDISEPMITSAKRRAQQENSKAEFICADAQTHAFEPASFDTLISRFGVMFFEDPVGAFVNLRRAATAAAEMRFIAWRGAEENPFMTTAERAAAPLLPDLPPRRPDAPGQFGFAKRDRVQRILESSGWSGIDIQPIDVSCSLPASELERYVTRFGPVGMFLQDADEATRTRVSAVVLEAFRPFVQGAQVRFQAACWMIAAASRM